MTFDPHDSYNGLLAQARAMHALIRAQEQELTLLRQKHARQPDLGAQVSSEREANAWLTGEHERLSRQVTDLAMLVTRLARALHKASPLNTLPDKAMDYLKRQGLLGSPLRGDQVGE